MKEWWTHFKLNMAYWYQYAQAWAVAIWSGAYALWVSELVNDETRQAFYAAMPFGLGKYMPFIVLAVAWFTAHGWPQPNLAAKVAAKVAATDAAETNTNPPQA